MMTEIVKKLNKRTKSKNCNTFNGTVLFKALLYAIYRQPVTVNFKFRQRRVTTICYARGSFLRCIITVFLNVFGLTVYFTELQNRILIIIRYMDILN